MSELAAALERHVAGDLITAEAAYRRLLACDPRNGNALNLIGVLLHQTGRSAEAAEALSRATELLPGFADAHSNRALVALDLGDVASAGQAILRALVLAPAHPAARQLAARWQRGQGAERFAAGDFAAALAAFSEADRYQPDYAEVQLDLANTLRRLARRGEALIRYRRALALASDSKLRAHCMVALATVLREDGQWIEALAHFRQAAEQDPDSADASQGVGVILMEIGRAEEALPWLRRAVALAPAKAGFHSALLGALNYCAEPDPAGQFAAHLEWAELHAKQASLSGSATPPAAFVEPPSRVPQLFSDGDVRRWRIGLLSADLREHPVARFVESWLPQMAGRPFEFIAYSDAATEDDISRRLQPHFSQWIPVSRLDDAALAGRIAADRLDLLIELSGHTSPNRLRALVTRPAPRIWSWIGYPATTGLSQVDGRLCDAVADPAGSEAFFSERLIRLPGCFLCYAPPTGLRDRLPLADKEAAAGSGFVFGSFNNLSKLTEQGVAVWAEVLRAAPGSRLRLKSFVLSDPLVAAEVVGRFAAHGIAAERLLLGGFVASPGEHFAHYQAIDLALDPFPYNGTTTTCDALWMGVPVLTLSGSRHAGRVGVSLLKAALGDDAAAWIAEDPADFIRRAVAAAGTGKRTLAQRAALRARVETSPLMDAAQFAEQLAAVLVENLQLTDPLPAIPSKTGSQTGIQQ